MSADRKKQLARFFFSEAKPSSVTLFRVLLAILLAYAFLPRGLEPRSPPALIDSYAELFLSTPYRILMYAGLLAFGLGWFPRTVGIVLVGLIFPHCFLNEGQQSRQVLICVLLFTSLLPGQPVWRRANPSTQQPRGGPTWPIRLIQLQVTVLYGVNAIAKSTPEYLDGSVIAALSARPNFHVDLTDGYLSLGPLAIPVALLASATVLTEYAIALGFWLPKCRWATALLGVVFHISLLFVIEIFMLNIVSVFLYLAFLLPFGEEEKKKRQREEKMVVPVS